MRGGNLEIPVDKASLEAFLSGNETVEVLVDQAREEGFAGLVPGGDGYQQKVDVDLRDLVTVLDGSGIKTIAELDALLKDEKFMTDAIKRLGPAISRTNFRWRTPMDLLCVLILFQTEAPQERVTAVYRPTILDLFDAARGSVGNGS